MADKSILNEPELPYAGPCTLAYEHCTNYGVRFYDDERKIYVVACDPCMGVLLTDRAVYGDEDDEYEHAD